MRAGETTAVSPSPFRHSSVVRKVLNESACAISSGMGLCLHLGLVSSWLLGDAKELIQLLLTLEMESSSFSTGLCPVLLGTPLKSAVWGGFTEHRILERPGLEGILKFSTQLLF